MQHIPQNPVFRQTTIHAELIGDEFARAAGIVVRGPAPILRLCRALLAAGHDPDTGLKCVRGATVALTVASVGAAARLKINSKGTGFVAAGGVRTGSLVPNSRRGHSAVPPQHARAQP